MIRKPPRRTRGPSSHAERLAPKTRPFDSRIAAFLAVAVYCLLVVRVLVPGFFDYGPNSGMIGIAERDAVFNKITWLTFAGVSAALVFARASAATRLLRETNHFYVALVILATCSTIWSIDRTATLARVFHVFTVFLACSAVTLIDWQERRFQNVTRPIFTALVLGSLIFGLVAPELAIDPPIPPDTKFYWHGLADQKNQLGALASIGVIFWVHAWASREVKLFKAALWGGLSADCLILSRSSTSILVTILVCGFLMLMLRSTPGIRRYMPYVIGLIVVVTLLYGMAVLNVVPGLDSILTPITDLAGKDRTFSNRARIWQIIQEHISHSPFLGTGYGAYWTGPRASSPSFVFIYKMFFYPGESHNGYLEIINDLGYAGLLLLIGYIWLFIRECLRLLKTHYAQASLYLAMLFQQLLTNLSESHWFFLQVDFVMFTLATLCLARSRMSREAPPRINSAAPRPMPVRRDQRDHKSRWSRS